MRQVWLRVAGGLPNFRIGNRPKFLEIRVDHNHMNVSGVSINDVLATQATHMKAGTIGTQLAITVLKSVLDSQEQQAQMLVEMIQQTAASTGVGSNVDIRG